MNLDPEMLSGIKSALRLHPLGMGIADLVVRLGADAAVIDECIGYLRRIGEVQVKSEKDAEVFVLSQQVLSPAILRLSNEMIVMLDAKRRIIQMNDAFAELCDMDAASMLGESFSGIAADLTSDLPIDDYLIHPEKQKLRTFIRFLKQDGKDRFFNIKMAQWKFEDASNGVVLLIEDATARRSAELALAEAQHLFRDVLQNIQDVFYRTDLDGNLVMASDSFARMMGYDTIDECLGRNLAESFYQHPARNDEMLAQLRKEGMVWDYEVLMKQRDGSPLPVALNSHLYFGPDGAELGVEGTFRDVSERKDAQERIHRHIERIVELSKELLDFVDRPAHGQALLRARSECGIDRVRG
jgi:PAS domain S-box-containing protein